MKQFTVYEKHSEKGWQYTFITGDERQALAEVEKLKKKKNIVDIYIDELDIDSGTTRGIRFN